MEPMDVEFTEGTQELSADPLPFAREYQLEALEAAIKQNTIVFLETGSGKTLIAIMLLRSYANFLRKPSPFFAVFLVPTAVLVQQQSKALMMHTDLKVGKYRGRKGVAYSDAASWRKEVDEHEVLVMTPAILLAALRHGFLKIDMIKVLIFDECQHARGKDPYACIMTEFYHQELNSKNSNLPRILGMTASPIKAKVCRSDSAYWQEIRELENLMHSKIFTCASESVLAKYIPFPTPKLKSYEHRDIPYHLFVGVANELKMLRNKPEYSLGETLLSESMAESTMKKLDEIFSTLLFCLSELGIWLALKAAEHLSSDREFVLEKVDMCGKTIVKNFCLEASKVFSASIQSGPSWNAEADIDAGYLTSKVICLIESLLEYREVKDLRCIIFVERIITAMVLKIQLNELFMELNGWRTAYTVGSQSRNEQNRTVEEFRNGRVNIIVATSMLEEGLDVQSCNLVITFDPSTNVSSFIQSRGRARMQNSHLLIMLKSGDTSTLARVENFLASGETMRQQSLIHASVPCAPLDDLCVEAFYKVEATGAVVNLSSSVQLLSFYCSKLPSDGYFKPTPKFVIDKDSEICTLHLPRGCPIQTIVVQGKPKKLKQRACLEACKKLHQIGALSDNLVPDIVEEKKEAQQNGSMGIGFGKYIDKQVKYVPPELIGCASNDPRTLYHCYLIELDPDYNYDIKPHDIMLALRTRLEFDHETLNFDLDVDRGSLMVTLRYHEDIELNPEQVLLCQEFQRTALRVLIDQTLDKQHGVLGESGLRDECAVFDYLLLPTTGSHQDPLINWECVNSVRFPCGSEKHVDRSHARCHGRLLHTFMDPVCSCMLENCLVVTPHDGFLYCISGILDTLDGNSLMKGGGSITYRSHFKRRHNIKLRAVEQPLLSGKRVFSVKNYLHRCRIRKTKESSNTSVELPPELCHVIMSPISVASFYTFSYAPSIMHRVESLLLAANLKGILVDHCIQNVVIPTVQVLEAITTKHCQENFHLDSLATFGDSFLKYAVSQQLFKTYQDDHEGLLSNKREKIISKASLCRLGCDCKIQGFIRNEPFDPKAWIIPGDSAGAFTLDEELVSSRRIFYSSGRRRIKIKRVADVVEALIGAFLGSGGELAALSFLKWLGIEVDFIHRPYTMPIQLCPRKLVDVKFLESLFNYKFHDASLLVEALTHGSSMVPEIPRCYQRLEFLGDAVLDYLITKYLYRENPGLLPGLLTDLRSGLVNNECYAQSAIKAGLHKHIRSSQELRKQIATSVQIFEKSSVSTSVWESKTILPKVLGDIIESLAGAIFLDSGYCKEIVFDSIRPLLQPMITPETLKLHPVRELTELCQKEHYVMSVTRSNGTTTVEVAANGVIHKHSSSVTNKRTAKRLACNAVLKSLNKSVSSTQMCEKLVHVCLRLLGLFLFLFYLHLLVESWNFSCSFV